MILNAKALKDLFSTLFHTAWLVCGCLGVGISCHSGGEHDSDTARSTGQHRFRVALLTPGPISDQSWNAGAYQGLLRIRDSLGAEISHIQTETPAAFDENFREYGAKGYDLVFGHGFEFQDAALRVGKEYPRTIFVTTSGNSVAPNVAGMEFSFAEASYLAGMLAGASTSTGLVACIGGTELPPVRRSFSAFAAGARSVNPHVRVVTSYVGSWNDVSAGKEQALAQISRGADVIFQNADAAGLGVFQAARETRKAMVIGSNSDQNGVASEVTLGSVVIDLPHAFLAVAREVRERRFRARVISVDRNSAFVLNPARASGIPSSVRSAIDSMTILLRDGRFVPPGDTADAGDGRPK